jgi:hypothetical protein
MTEPSFDSTPEFQHFSEVMRGVLAVPKKRIDELVRSAREHSPRNGDPHAPGKKRSKNRRSSDKATKVKQPIIQLE